ncbi:MAG TPA: hypothetical protein VMG12_18615 [Polyangiaceae bacterium]|nr:hypothetical protein [Polyangiaceae bacterium]
MAKRAFVGWVVSMGLWACGAADDAPSDAAPASPAPGSAAPGGRDVTPVARYQFVSTPEGMAVEAVSERQVQTFSCPSRTCAGLCDECAARACRAAGELSGACRLVVSSCNDSCSCPGGTEGSGSCGFPVCSVDRMVCLVGDATDGLGGGPSAPGDPSPIDFAGRPSESSSNTSRPAD